METTNKELATRLLDELQQETGQALECDRPALYASLAREKLQLNQLPIKIISILGGLLSAGLFTGFLFALGLGESGVVICLLGGLFIGGSLLVINQDVSTYFSATAIAFLVIGLALIGAGVGMVSESNTAIALALMLVCGGLFFATTHSLVVFLITILFLGSSFVLFSVEESFFPPMFVALYTGVLLFWSLSEVKLVTESKQLNEAYRSARMGMVLSFAVFMVFLASGEASYTEQYYPWISGVVLLIALFIFTQFSLQELREADSQLTTKKSRAFLLMPLLMLPLLSAPGVVGSFLLMLLGFRIRHLPSLIAGITAFCYALLLFYYDLNLTLLEKSGMLLLSGGWFFIGYILLKRR